MWVVLAAVEEAGRRPATRTVCMGERVETRKRRVAGSISDESCTLRTTSVGPARVGDGTSRKVHSRTAFRRPRRNLKPVRSQWKKDHVDLRHASRPESSRLPERVFASRPRIGTVPCSPLCPSPFSWVHRGSRTSKPRPIHSLPSIVVLESPPRLEASLPLTISTSAPLPLITLNACDASIRLSLVFPLVGGNTIKQVSINSPFASPFPFCA